MVERAVCREWGREGQGGDGAGNRGGRIESQRVKDRDLKGVELKEQELKPEEGDGPATGAPQTADASGEASAAPPQRASSPGTRRRTGCAAG